jgi:hypothetical protein
VPSASPPRIAVAGVGLGRVIVGASVIVVLCWTYGLNIAEGRPNFFDYFGYFTNLTSLLTSTLLILTGALAMRARPAPAALAAARAVATTCMLIVAVIYNILVPGTGSAPIWVSVTLHIVFPLVVALDWLLVGDRSALPWHRLWTVVLARGATDGWVPYGFLLPDHGPQVLAAHVLGLLAALLVAAVLVWLASRMPGLPALLNVDEARDAEQSRARWDDNSRDAGEVSDRA